jgi:KUP system potassium uptake protein
MIGTVLWVKICLAIDDLALNSVKFRISLMLLWTWAKRLEDGFDGENRQNLRHFIFRDVKPATLTLRPNYEANFGEEETDQREEDTKELASYCISAVRKDKSSGDDEKDRKQELVRIPTLAIFHKLATGRGVPHSFVGAYKEHGRSTSN